MAHTQTKVVDYTDQNVSLCQCGNCPVQTPSSCAADLNAKVAPIREQHQVPTNAKELPRIYCSTGTSACSDFDGSKQCICPTCDVWKSYDLANYKYCLNGSAQQIG